METTFVIAGFTCTTESYDEYESCEAYVWGYTDKGECVISTPIVIDYDYVKIGQKITLPVYVCTVCADCGTHLPDYESVNGYCVYCAENNN